MSEQRIHDSLQQVLQMSSLTGQEKNLTVFLDCFHSQNQELQKQALTVQAQVLPKCSNTLPEA